ncbi:helix-turn-helix domain-containing protein [Aeromicrobium endophyticum]|uniref:helix-turn-helix domain-containing protein n=1 Tax=Aeromicrobium endophyticum TaxID=2292704 RepID=UPI001F3A9EA4|nr:helix-turn-helix domain-containing protein [Aeromicrobium endophyticum]
MRVTSWASERIAEPVSVADLAEVGAVSVASLHRAFRAELGTTPLAWLTAQRVDRARELLEQTAMPVEAVARASGLGSAANLRRRFREASGATPTQHRRQFGTTTPTRAQPSAGRQATG